MLIKNYLLILNFDEHAHLTQIVGSAATAVYEGPSLAQAIFATIMVHGRRVKMRFLGSESEILCQAAHLILHHLRSTQGQIICIH